MKNLKKKIVIASCILGIIIAILVALFFYFRETLLQQAIAKVTNKLSNDFDAKLTLNNAKFDGFTAISIDDIALVPKNADTIFKIEKIKTSISFWNLFLGKIQLGSLEAKNGYVQLIKNNKGKNFDAFLNRKKTTATENLPAEKRNYAETAYKIISMALNLVPTDMALQNLTFVLDDMGKKATIYCKSLSLDNQDLESDIEIKTTEFTQRLRLKGTADPRDEQCDIEFFNLDKGAIQIPYIKERFGLISSFNSIRWNVADIDWQGDDLHLAGVASVKNLLINHPKIALRDVLVNEAQFDYKFILGANSVAIDSSSQVSINKLKFNPYLAIETEKDTIIRLKVTIPKMPAQDYISSLPEGLFDNIKGMKTSGEFDFKLNFFINKNKPKLVAIDSKLNKYDLKILEFGNAKLDKINTDFEYRAIVKDELQRPVLVGVTNINYTPMALISPLLVKTVLTTEDPSFMSHKGFVTEAFRTSIIKNLETKKFSRGGSTISMQLVKNVFLTREKTLSRKLEEILLVFILENNRIVTKNRMLEVYFNIIEWGPDVYGIAEASQFYFQKKPIDLSLNECLFLAHIIPSPRKFMNQFGSNGNLSGKAIAKNNYITNIMIKRKIIDPSYASTRFGGINVTGKARSFIKISKVQIDTMAQDSIALPLELEDEEEVFEF